MSSLDDFKKKIEEFRSHMRENYENVLKRYESSLEDFKKADLSSKDKLITLYLDIKRLRIDFKHELQNLYTNFRETIYNFRRNLRELALNLPKEYGRPIDEIRDILIETSEDLKKYLRLSRDLEESLKEFEFRIRDLLSMETPNSTPSISVKIDTLTEALEDTLKEVFSSTEKILSKATEVVSSIRIPESDAKLIKLLVDAGIFRSRNEALAYFAHKGIEASRDWLNRVQERLHKIRELQEETRKELEEIFKEDFDQGKSK